MDGVGNKKIEGGIYNGCFCTRLVASTVYYFNYIVPFLGDPEIIWTRGQMEKLSSLS